MAVRGRSSTHIGHELGAIEKALPIARTVRDTNLEKPAARARLASRRKPYWRVLESGLHLGYRRTKEGGGSWVARRFVGEGKFSEQVFGVADDLQEADGATVVRDLFITARVKQQDERVKLLSERLSNLYSPLMFYMGGGGDNNSIVINIIEADQELNKLVKANFHLLSPSLQNIISEVPSLGRHSEGGKSYSSDDIERILEPTKAFRTELRKEYADLRDEYMRLK